MTDTDPEHETDRGTARTESTQSTSRLRRRTVVTATGTVIVGGLAGCLGGSQDDGPDPVTLTETAECDVCGMVISQHPGPTTEIFYADADPGGHGNPARFDSTWEAFQFDFQHDDWTREAFYVTDYSAVDYTIDTEQGDSVISTHYNEEAFVDATEITFVIDSKVIGAMGRDLIGFSDQADAEAFRDEYGGELIEFGEVTPEVISTLGR
jgi:nitrous oxide reductase accessory protein NosL